MHMLCQITLKPPPSIKSYSFLSNNNPDKQHIQYCSLWHITCLFFIWYFAKRSRFVFLKYWILLWRKKMRKSKLRILIVAEHVSARFGGEAFLPLHYFRVLRSRGIEAWLLCHSRSECMVRNRIV